MARPSDAIPADDRRILRELGKRIADIAALPVQAERQALWTCLNDLHTARPMVWLFEVPWNEMNVDEELTVRSTHPACKGIELQFRRKLYQWDHMQGDMVVEPFFGVGPALRDTGFGIGEQVDVARTDPTSDVVSRHYHIQIASEADIAKIQIPQISLDEEAWDRNAAFYADLFDGVLPVRKIGVRGTSVAPWDLLVRLTGVEELLADMCIRPAYVHKLIGRLTDAYTHRLDRYEQLNVLGLNNETFSGGGYQHTTELPPPDCDPARIRPRDMWGRTMSQIFSAVSPAMHEEFALQYECKWLHRFGLTYYGCCEPLDRKVGILRANVPNLRKISMSPWIDLDVAADAIGTDYVFSWKPNPEVLAHDDWDPDFVRNDARRTLTRLKGMHVEIIMKDISTVRHDPPRLWDWARVVTEVAHEFAT